MSYFLFNGDIVFIRKIDCITINGSVIQLQFTGGNQINCDFGSDEKAKLAMEKIATQLAII